VCHACTGVREYSATGSSSCSTCASGKIANSTHTGCITITSPCCVTNSSGTKSTIDSLNGCQQAAMSGAQITNGACPTTPTTGILCPAGKGATGTPTSITDCSYCAKGYYSPADDNKCYQCPSGKTSPVGSEKESDCVEAVLLQTLDITSGSAYVVPEDPKTFYIHPIGENGKAISTVTWTVTASNSSALASADCKAGNPNCIVKVKGWGCDQSATVTVTAKDQFSNKTATAKISVTSYKSWSEGTWNKPLPEGGYIHLTTAKDHPVCRAYNGYNTTTKTYAHYYDRCCGSTPPPTPTPETSLRNPNTGLIAL
jgi:hypothetical protein